MAKRHRSELAPGSPESWPGTFHFNILLSQITYYTLSPPQISSPCLSSKSNISRFVITAKISSLISSAVIFSNITIFNYPEQYL